MSLGIYNKYYSKQYIKQSLLSGYTQYKHKIISGLIEKINPSKVLDVGCNINASVIKGSLRTEVEKRGIGYFGIDVDQSYFEKKSLIKLGVGRNNLYKNIAGCIGDIHALPIKTSSEEVVVVADVLEHVEDLDSALKELHRILIPGGILIVILPYFYKLDCFKLEYIDEIRKSSHINKLGMCEWLNLFRRNDFEYISKMSRSIGFLSGLCYLLWFNKKWIPEKNACGCENIATRMKEPHTDLKELLSGLDELADPLISSKTCMLYLTMLYEGRFLEMSDGVKSLLTSISTPICGGRLISSFLNSLSLLQTPFDEKMHILTECKKLMDEGFGVGNAYLFVLKKNTK